MVSLICVKPRPLAIFLALGVCGSIFCLSASGQTAPLSAVDESLIASSDEAEKERLAVGHADWVQQYPAIAEAKKSLEAGNGEAALRQLARAAEENPELPQAEVILADFYFAGNNLVAAIAALDSAVRNKPGDPEPYLILGNLAFTQNRNTEAKLLFEKAATLVKSMTFPQEKQDRIMLRLHAGQASVNERADAWGEAIKHLEEWIKIDPKNPAAHVRLARALFRTNQGKKAYVRAKKASVLSNKFAKAPILIAQFYSETGQEELAEQWLSEAEKRYSNDLTTRLVLAEREWRRGRKADAKRHAKAASQIDPTSAKAALLVGMIAQLEHDFTKAERSYAMARDSAPKEFAPRNYLALVLALQGGEDKLEDALRLAQANRQDFPNSAVAAATLGFVQQQMGQPQEAVKNLQLAGSAGRGTADMAYIFAKFWADQGEKERARKVLGQLLSSSNNKTLFVLRRNAEQLYRQLGGR